MAPRSPGFVGSPACWPACLSHAFTPRSLVHSPTCSFRTSLRLPPSLPPLGRMEMRRGLRDQGGMEESPAFFLEGVAAVSPCSTGPLSPGSPGGLATTQASFSLRDVQERIHFCCFKSPRLWGFVQAARDTSTVRLPGVGPSPASPHLPRSPRGILGLWGPSSPGDGQHLWLGLGLSPASRAFQPLDCKPRRGGWGTRNVHPHPEPQAAPLPAWLFRMALGFREGQRPKDVGLECGPREECQWASPAGLRQVLPSVRGPRAGPALRGPAPVPEPSLCLSRRMKSQHPAALMFPRCHPQAVGQVQL